MFTPHQDSDMEPTAGLIPKYVGMCHSGHSDCIYTLALGHSDWLPTGHNYLSVGKQTNP